MKSRLGGRWAQNSVDVYRDYSSFEGPLVFANLHSRDALTIFQRGKVANCRVGLPMTTIGYEPY